MARKTRIVPPVAASPKNTTDRTAADIRAFLVGLATDPAKLGAFIRDANASMNEAGIAAEDQAILKSGNSTAIYARLIGYKTPAAAVMLVVETTGAETNDGEPEIALRMPAPDAGMQARAFQLAITPQIIVPQIVVSPILPQLVIPPIVPPMVYPQTYPQYGPPMYQQGFPQYPPPMYQQGFPQYPPPMYQQGVPQYPPPTYPQGHPQYPPPQSVHGCCPRASCCCRCNRCC
jgi:hypothetical protein